MQAQATAHTTSHRTQHGQVQEKTSDTSSPSDALSDQSQASAQTKSDPLHLQAQNQPRRWDNIDPDWKTVTKMSRTRTPQDRKPPEEDHRCKNCQASFQLSPEKIDPFLKRGLNLPLRCDLCIQRRKENTTTQPTSTPQIFYRAKNIKGHSVNPWTANDPITTRLQQDEFPAFPKPKTGPQASPIATVRA